MAMTASTSRKAAKLSTKNIPAFLNKLFAMVNDPSTNDLILWSDQGDSFYVPSPDKFGRELLPRFFKHSNFGSFVRQLNMYGFHKVPHLSHGVLKTDSEDGAELLEFSNPNFARGQPDLLCNIIRQKSRADAPQPVIPVETEHALDLPTLLTDLAAVRKHQSALTTDLAALEQSNRALWEEAIQSRERQKGHQETITKILRFLGTVFGGAQVNAGAAKGATNVTEEVVEGREGTDKGKGKEVSVQRRSRFLLEDVKERRDARAREMQIAEEDEDDEEEEDDDTIEEIGNQDNFTPITTASKYVAPRSKSTNLYPALPPLPTEQPSRFSDYLDPVLSAPPPAAVDSQYELAPDMLSSLLSPSNSNTLAAFMQLQNNGGLASPPILASYPPNAGGAKYDPTGHSNNLILPSPLASTTSTSSTNYHHQLSPRTLASLLPALPTNPSTLPEDYTQSITDHAEVLQEVQNEKADIDERTSALENAIEKLMNGLPVETRDALSAPTPSSATAGGVGEVAGGEMGGGLDWGAMSAGAGGDIAVGSTGEMDLDSFLAQYSNQATETPDYSYLFDPTSPSAIRLPAPPSSTLPPSVPSYLLPLNSNTPPGSGGIIEALSPSITNSSELRSRSSSLGPAVIGGGLGGGDEDRQVGGAVGRGKKVGATKKKGKVVVGKKRKSEVAGDDDDDDGEWGGKVETKKRK